MLKQQTLTSVIWAISCNLVHTYPLKKEISYHPILLDKAQMGHNIYVDTRSIKACFFFLELCRKKERWTQSPISLFVVHHYSCSTVFIFSSMRSNWSSESLKLSMKVFKIDLSFLLKLTKRLILVQNSFNLYFLYNFLIYCRA
jgi:hypothetical protein